MQMYSRWILIIGILVVLLIITLFVLGGRLLYWGDDASPRDMSYLDTTKSTDERVSILLNQMSLSEKIGQMALVEKNSVKDINDVARYGLGAILSGSGGKPSENTPLGWKDMTSAFQVSAKKSRLEIPILYGADANHGHSNVPGATIFPHAIGLGATHDEALVEKVAQATAREMVATGVNWTYSPSLDLPKDIRWGRVYESFGDDPVVVGNLGSAYIRGSQSTSTNDSFVMATPKHYLGIGSMVWGSSFNKNFKIDQGVTPVNETQLLESYLPPFRDAVGAGSLSVMAALSTWGNDKVSSSHYLLTDVLKGELGFKGFIVSDWYGVYEISKDEYQAAVLGINAGIDMVMLPFDYKTFIKNVTSAVQKGDISETRIDDAVQRILRAKFEAGLFEVRENSSSSIDEVGNFENRELARESVAKSMVLLKNKNHVLPLSPKIPRILVAGSGADNVGRMMGAWTVEWQGIDGNWLPGTESILAGIQKSIDAKSIVDFDMLGNFSTGTHATVGIVVVSEKPYAEGWGDNALPTISPEDREAILRTKAHVDSLVVIIVSGRPLIITDDIADFDGLIAAWLPGSQGIGVADVLFGNKPFTGTLPLPWPAHIGQLPLSSDGSTKDGSSVLFTRGFGLTTK